MSTLRYIIPVTVAAVLFCMAGCRPVATVSSAIPKQATTADPFAGAKRMGQLLDKIDEQSDPRLDRFLNTRRAELLETQLAKSTDARQQVMLLQQIAIERMNAGDIEPSIQASEKMAQLLQRFDSANRSGLRPVPDTLKAIAYMRFGEVQNCCASSSPDACLLPIKGGGIHTKPEGSRKAIALLTKRLTEQPTDLGARWLINIAYMTLGEYPSKVPAAWLIPPSTFASDYDIKPFPNIAAQAGVDLKQLAGGVILDDFNNDGNLDLFVSSFGLKDETHFFLNDGKGGFIDRSKEAGLIGERGGQNMIQADYNNDGLMDVLILRGGWRGKGGHQPRSLLKNNGDGTFTEVADEAGIQGLHPCMTAVWFDYDNDGWLDLFLGNESLSDDANPCELYHNNHDGTFTEVAKECGLDLVGYVKAAVSLDYNNDGRPDLYVSCWKEPNHLYRNDGKDAQGHWHFTDVGAEAGVTDPLGSFSCFAFDYDNDGYEDIFVTDYDIQSVSDVVADYLKTPTQAEHAKLFHNNGNGTFTDVTAAMHLDHVIYGMGINFGDLDNDGWLDFYVGTGAPNLSALIPNRMFRNAEGKFFQDVTTSGNFGHLQKGHAIAFGDIDGDGNQDIYESMGGAFEGDVARSVLYHNPGHGNHFVKVKLVGKESCRDAHGARLHLIVEQPGGTLRNIYRTVGSGGSFGANPLRQEIGIGQATVIRELEIIWPRTGKKQTVTGLAIDSTCTVTEGDSTAISR